MARLVGDQVIVSGHIAFNMEDLYSDIRANRFISYPPIEWSVIFGEIRWSDVSKQDGPHCARVLLEVVGRLCETIIQEGGGYVCPIRACEMMLIYWDRRGKYINYKRVKKSYSLVSTPACEREHGIRIKVRLTGEPINDVWWTLSD